MYGDVNADNIICIKLILSRVQDPRQQLEPIKSVSRHLEEEEEKKKKREKEEGNRVEKN